MRRMRLAGVPLMMMLALTGTRTASAAFDLPLPARHPYLALTPAGIAEAQARAGRFPWAKQTLTEVVQTADTTIAKPLGTLPAKGDTAHWGVASRLFQVGLAHAFTGERKYAQWVRDGLVAYAAWYPAQALTNRRCRAFTQSSLYEAMWTVNLAQAYDLVADGGAFSAAQREQVEHNLLRRTTECFKIDDYEQDPRIKDLHFRCYNFQAWHLAAVGLVGLAIRDLTMVDYAVNSRYGFRHLVAHDVRDDGLFWERSIGYHGFVLDALLPLCEALDHCGLDLYALSVPNDRSRGEDCHYLTDTTDTPKSLRLMFEAPVYAAFGDLSTPSLGDSGHGVLSAGWHELAAWRHYHDPLLAARLRHDIALGGGGPRGGRVGFLHYYRYQYRYDQIRLNGQPVVWGRSDTTYSATADGLAVADGGVSQSDRYLLSDAVVTDFTLEWTLTRLANSGGEDRAWLVFGVDPRTTAERESFALVGFCPQIGQAYHFRLDVHGDRCELRRDGQVVGTHPTSYHPSPDWHWLSGELPPAGEAGPLPLADGAFANSGVYRNGCSLFPASGLAVLRQAAGDFTAQPDATAVSFSYGPYGGGHGHPDKLSLALYADGRQWIPQFASMPYETHWKAEWTAQTVSHNTVVIDGVSQQPTGDRNVMWPVDSGDKPVCGRLEAFDAATKSVAATCDTAYPGFVLRRAVRLDDGVVVDRFTVTPAAGAAPAQHTFDYVLHVDGTLAASSQPLAPCPGPLGTKCGYQYVEQRQASTVTQPLALTFAAGRPRLRIWIAPGGPAPLELIVAEGLTDSPTGKMPMVVLRQVGERAEFSVVLEPVGHGRPVTTVRTEAAGVVVQR